MREGGVAERAVRFALLTPLEAVDICPSIWAWLEASHGSFGVARLVYSWLTTHSLFSFSINSTFNFNLSHHF
jgi:hypothetical protein